MLEFLLYVDMCEEKEVKRERGKGKKGCEMEKI